MFFVPSSVRGEDAFPLDLHEAAALFRRYVSDDARLREYDAVLVKAHVALTGRPTQIGAVKPRVWGFLPRPLPMVFDGQGNRLSRPRWLDDDQLLELATRAVASVRFAAAMVNGCCVDSTVTFALTVRLVLEPNDTAF